MCPVHIERTHGEVSTKKGNEVQVKSRIKDRKVMWAGSGLRDMRAAAQHSGQALSF